MPFASALLLRDCSEVTTAFAYLMTDMWLGDSDCVSPEIFLSAVGSLYPAFLKKTQQDAQEFLIYVLNELHEALKKVRTNSPELGDVGCMCIQTAWPAQHLLWCWGPEENVQVRIFVI